MFYIDIDVGKRHHKVGVIDEKEQPINKTLRFKNAKSDSEKLLALFNQHL